MLLWRFGHAGEPSSSPRFHRVVDKAIACWRPHIPQPAPVHLSGYRGLINQQTPCCNQTTNANRVNPSRPLAKLGWFGNDSVHSPNPSRTVGYTKCIRLTCSPHTACHSRSIPPSFSSSLLHSVSLSLALEPSFHSHLRHSFLVLAFRFGSTRFSSCTFSLENQTTYHTDFHI
jgi:hypothetical protein